MTRTSATYALIAHLSRPRVQPTGDVPWGMTMPEPSLIKLWAPRHPEDVEADELALYLPGLSISGPFREQISHRLEAHARSALAARIHWFLLGSGRVPPIAPSSAGAVALAESGVLTGMSLAEAAEAGARIVQDWFGSERLKSAAHPSRESITSELSIVACLNDLVERAQSLRHPPKPRDGAEAYDNELLQALAASVHAGLNAAYIHPAYESLHAYFTTGAWIGYLLRGRPALLPAFVAEYLVDILERPGSDASNEGARCDALLRKWAEEAAGCELLIDCSRTVLRRGARILVPPKPVGHAPVERSLVHRVLGKLWR